MLTALSGSTKVLARDVNGNDGPFNCPSCQSEVNVKKGQIKIHHFAHKVNPNCKLSAFMTDDKKNPGITVECYPAIVGQSPN